MSNYLDVYVKDSLKRVPGVADVIIFGERKYSMRLWLDPVRMAGRGLTAPTSVSALQEQNVEVAAGQVGQPPIKPARNFRSACAPSGGSAKPSQFENIILKTNADGTLVRLKDVGRAELGAEDYSSDLHVQRAATPSASASPSSRTRTRSKWTAWRIAELDRLSKRFPPGHEIPESRSTPPTRSANRSGTCSTRWLEAIVLVILVIFIFLQDWRSTIIPAITIPVSLIGTLPSSSCWASPSIRSPCLASRWPPDWWWTTPSW